MHTLIIGSGLAGITLARELRKLDKTRTITLMTADDGSFYSKPNLSNAFAAGKHPDQMTLTTTAKLETDLAVTIMAHTAVTRIDAESREVVYAQGRLAYDQLVLAVGASQIPLPLAGDGIGDAISVNSLNDYARLSQRLVGKHKVAIIGAGLIGCEFANDLRLGDFAVDLFDMAPQPLSRLLPESASQAMQDQLAAIGVGFHLSTKLTSMQRDGDAYLLTDSQGTAHRYDLVLSAIGLKPKLELAQSANLATRTGIVTNAFLQTSDPNIYAIGDCIEIEGLYLPYVMPIMQGAKKLAATLTGNPEAVTYPAMPIVVKTPACPTVVSPPPASAGHWQEEITDAGIRALYIEQAGGQACGFVLQGSHTKERMALTAKMPGLAAK